MVKPKTRAGQYRAPNTTHFLVLTTGRPLKLKEFYPSVEKLQKALDQWLHYYNYEKPHRGYRNVGKRPIETIETGKVIKEQVTIKEAA